MLTNHFNVAHVHHPIPIFFPDGMKEGEQDCEQQVVSKTSYRNQCNRLYIISCNTDNKNAGAPTNVQGYLEPRWLQGNTLDRFGRCQSITFHRFRIEICCIHEISYLSLYCTGKIIFFVIFTHSIHKFLPLSLIPPHKNHPARRSGRNTPGFPLPSASYGG